MHPSSVCGPSAVRPSSSTRTKRQQIQPLVSAPIDTGTAVETEGVAVPVLEAVAVVEGEQYVHVAVDAAMRHSYSTRSDSPFVAAYSVFSVFSGCSGFADYAAERT